MNPVAFTCLSVLLYAISNVIFEQKFAKYSLGPIMTYFSIGALIFSLIIYGWEKATTPVLATPPKTEILLICGLSALFFLADYLYVMAYKAGGNVYTITTIFVIFPLFAGLLKYFYTKGQVPNKYEVAGYFFAVISIYCYVKGTTT